MAWFKSFLDNKGINALILKITCLSWLITKLMSRRIWTAARLLPTAPLFEFFDRVPPLVHSVLFLLSILSIVWLLIENNKFVLTGLLLAEICTCILDQNRLMPLEYLYCFIIFINIIHFRRPALVPACIGILLVSTYFYGGLCKLNDGFLQVIWSKMFLQQFLKMPAALAAQKWMYYGGYLLGTGELLGGLGLLFAKTQSRSAKSLIVMHLLILAFLGPFGLRGYLILWPWNISMMLFLYLVFLEKKQVVKILPHCVIGWGIFISVCWLILPFFSFFGYWDYNMSSNLWSGNVPRMIICIRDTSQCKPLQRFLSKRDITNTCHGQGKIEIQRWAIAETGVAAYPQVRIYHIMQKKIVRQFSAAGLSFIYLDR